MAVIKDKKINNAITNNVSLKVFSSLSFSDFCLPMLIAELYLEDVEEIDLVEVSAENLFFVNF
jgi:hypothetical protein